MAIYQGDKLVAENITIDKSLYTLPVGSIIPYGSNTAPTGFLLCDGSEVSKETYPDLYAVIGDSFGTATDGKFKLPDLRGKFVQGANGDLATVKEAGLPNIAGQFYQDVNTRGRVSGAFSYTGSGYQNLANDTPTNSGVVYFDASKSNAIYGSSDTVQPPAVCLSYIIKALKISDEPNDQYATKDDIAEKVDKVDGMSLIEDTEKARLATVVNYDDTDIKADITSLQADKVDKTSLATVATTGSYNDLLDKPDKSDYKVFMQETQPTEDGLWIKGAKKDFMFVPSYVNNLNYSFNIVDTGVSMPTTLSKSSATTINGKAYIFGGYDATSKTYSDSIVEFDPTANTCTKLSVSLPSGRREAYAVTINGKAYIFGGYDGSNSLADILCFDPTTNTCTKLSASLPVYKYHCYAVVVWDKAYIFGGNFNAQEIYCFDPTANTCKKMPVTMPSGFAWGDAATIGSGGLIYGGDIEPSFYLFHSNSLTPASLPVVSPVTSYSHSAVLNSCLYIFGGSVKGSSSNKYVFEFNPRTYEICKVLYWKQSGNISSIATINSIAYIFCNDGKIFKTSQTADSSDVYLIGIKESSGVLTKVSTDTMIPVKHVKKSTNFNSVEAYSVRNGVATKIE